MARYREAIFWIVANDDTDFLDDEGSISVTASFAADMFGPGSGAQTARPTNNGSRLSGKGQKNGLDRTTPKSI
jgi:hypothetical protein